MKNRIKKQKRYTNNLDSPTAKNLQKSALLYNFASMGIFIEILIGALLGIALCFGFVLSFFIIKGSLIISLGIFFIILIFAIFLVLVLKYVYFVALLKAREIELLESIDSKA